MELGSSGGLEFRALIRDQVLTIVAFLGPFGYRRARFEAARGART